MIRALAITTITALTLVAIGSPAPAKDDPAPPEAMSPAQRAEAKRKQREAERAFQDRINKAIDKGTEWLKAQQLTDGTFPLHGKSEHYNQGVGRQSLALLTLIKCGVKKKDGAIKKGLDALRVLRVKFDQPAFTWMTYSSAVTLMLYEALMIKPERNKAKKSTRKKKPSKKKKKTKKAKGPFMEHAEILVKRLVGDQTESGWRYPGGDGPNQDLSNTQYALLGLRSAINLGIDIEPTVFRKALAYMFQHQRVGTVKVPTWIPNPAYEPGITEDRYGPFMAGPRVAEVSWAYMPDSTTKWANTGSMTTAGLAVVAIVKERLVAEGKLDMPLRRKIDMSLRGGLAWMGNHFQVDRNPGQSIWHYYYLYGMERVGALLGVTHMGKHEWYKEGATYLLDQQKEPGNWWNPPRRANDDHTDPLLQTCFALLFLKRATLPPPMPLGPVVTDGE